MQLQSKENWYSRELITLRKYYFEILPCEIMLCINTALLSALKKVLGYFSETYQYLLKTFDFVYSGLELPVY